MNIRAKMNKLLYYEIQRECFCEEFVMENVDWRDGVGWNVCECVYNLSTQERNFRKVCDM